jgi:hypothetical protein
MPNVILIDPLKDPRWDRFVESHPFGWVCHLSGWKLLLESSFPHMQGYYFALLNDSLERIEAGLPVFHVRSLLTGSRLVSAPFATLFDPLVSTPGQVQQLLPALQELCVNLKAKSIEVRTLSAGRLMADDSFATCCFYKHHYLDLAVGPDALMKSFHRTCVRQRICRAKECNLMLSVGKSESDMKEFYRLYKLTRRRVSRPVQPYRFIKGIWDAFRPDGRAELLLAFKEGTAIGGLLLLKFNQRVSAEYAVSDENFKNVSPNHFLFCEAILRAFAEGFKIFDFGRTASDNTSLMDFKRRWGTRVVDLPQYCNPQQFEEAGAAGKGSWKTRLAEGFIKAAPEFMQEWVGSAIYHHMA